MRRYSLFVLSLLLFLSTAAFAVSPRITEDQTALATQKLTHPTTVTSANVVVSQKFGIRYQLNGCPVEATANTNPPLWRVQYSTNSVGSNNWNDVPGCVWTASVVTADTETFSETEAIGVTSIIVPTEGDFAAREKLFIEHSTITSSVWGSVRHVRTAQTVELNDGLPIAQDNSSIMWNGREDFTCSVDIPGLYQTRVRFEHDGDADGTTGADYAIRALFSTFDSVQE